MARPAGSSYVVINGIGFCGFGFFGGGGFGGVLFWGYLGGCVVMAGLVVCCSGV